MQQIETKPITLPWPGAAQSSSQQQICSSVWQDRPQSFTGTVGPEGLSARPTGLRV